MSQVVYQKAFALPTERTGDLFNYVIGQSPDGSPVILSIVYGSSGTLFRCSVRVNGISFLLCPSPDGYALSTSEFTVTVVMLANQMTVYLRVEETGRDVGDRSGFSRSYVTIGGYCAGAGGGGVFPLCSGGGISGSNYGAGALVPDPRAWSSSHDHGTSCVVVGGGGPPTPNRRKKLLLCLAP